MKKPYCKPYIIASKLLFVMIAFCMNSEQVYNQTHADFKPSFKESNLQGDMIEHLDSNTLVYSNFKYGFAMDFPNNWSIDRGVSERTVIRAGQIDSAISFSINVIESSDMESDISIWALWDNKDLGLEATFRNSLTKSVNSEIYNFNARKVYISNREAIQTKFNFLFKNVDVEYENQCLFYSIYRAPFTYTIALHVPKILYDQNPQRFNYMINNFVLMKPK